MNRLVSDRINEFGRRELVFEAEYVFDVAECDLPKAKRTKQVKLFTKNKEIQK